MGKLLIKRVIPSVIVIALVVLGALWAYGFLGVKCGFIGPTEITSLNAVSKSGAEVAGGAVEAAKVQTKKTVEKAKSAVGL